jgi:phage tail protein X
MNVMARQGDTLDMICWRHLGQTSGAVEATLVLNPGLARRGLMLPEGTTVTLPDESPSIETAIVQLWS